MNSKTDKINQLAQEEYIRYSRHLILPKVGEEGQHKIKASNKKFVFQNSDDADLFLDKMTEAIQETTGVRFKITVTSQVFNAQNCVFLG